MVLVPQSTLDTSNKCQESCNAYSFANKKYYNGNKKFEVNWITIFLPKIEQTLCY